MIRTIILLITLLWTSNLSAQIRDEMDRLLTTKDFKRFKKYADSLGDEQESKSHIKCYWNYLRDITTDFKEGTLYFSGAVPDTDSPGKSIYCDFRVALITSATTIIYYDLSIVASRGEDGRRFKSLSRYKNKADYTRFRAGFKQIFQTNVNEAELFEDDFVYGTACGPSGTPPDAKVLVNQFVKRKDKASLIKWLKSTNTEKQIYAVDGLFHLKKRGVFPTREELAMIQFVVHKKGTVNICDGCDWDSDEIRKVTRRFRF